MIFNFNSIGVIRTPFKDIAGMPIQPRGAVDILGRVELDESLTSGLQDLAGFSHLILVYGFHKSRGYELQVKPFLGNRKRGLFATRAPRRPNPVGLSIVQLVRIDGPILHIQGADVLDGTPLLDIKPYVPQFDAFPEAKAGWLTDRTDRLTDTKSDERFRS